jgi:hypothetical protein
MTDLRIVRASLVYPIFRQAVGSARQPGLRVEPT